MILYENSCDKNVINSISDYIYLRSFDKDLIGIYLFAYYDDLNCFELVCFNNSNSPTNGYVVGGETIVGDNFIKYINLDINSIDNFSKEMLNGIVLYDPQKILCNINAKNILNNSSKEIKPTNQLLFNEKFTCDLVTSIQTKLGYNATNAFDEYLNIYYTLVDYYYSSIITDFDFEYDCFQDYLTYRLNSLYFINDANLHTGALLDAIKKAENISNKNKQKKIEG